MSNSGYIGLWRKIRDHWLWESSKSKSRFEAWLDILMEVRFDIKPTKAMFGGVVIECKYGQSLNSLDTWAKRWGWDKSKVRRYFDLLKTENMIRVENVSKTTRLTVLNYASYSPKRHSNDTLATLWRHSGDTLATPEEELKKVKNEKNVKKVILMSDFPEEIQTFVNRFNEYVIECSGKPMEKLGQQAQFCEKIMRNRKHTINEMNEILDALNKPGFWWRRKVLSINSLDSKVKNGQWKTDCILMQLRNPQRSGKQTSIDRMIELTSKDTPIDRPDEIDDDRPPTEEELEKLRKMGCKVD